MNINKKRLLVFLMTLILCQLQLSSLKSEDVKSIDDEELPALGAFGTMAAIVAGIFASHRKDE